MREGKAVRPGLPQGNYLRQWPPRTRHLIEKGDLIEIFPNWSDETFPLLAIYPSRQHRGDKVQVFTNFCIRSFGSRKRLLEP